MRVPGRHRTTRGRRIEAQHLHERQVGRMRQVEHLVEVHVVESGGVLKQVDEAHRIARSSTRCRSGRRTRARRPARSRSISPSSYICTRAPAMKVLLIEPARKCVSAVTGVRASRSARPTPPAHSTPFNRTSAIPAPGIPVSSSTVCTAALNSSTVFGCRSLSGGCVSAAAHADATSASATINRMRNSSSSSV